jgi:hypothetical protein
MMWPPKYRKCLGSGHTFSSCRMGWRCRRCLKLGHWAKDCTSRWAQIWRFKVKEEFSLSHQPRKVWVQKRKTEESPSKEDRSDKLMKQIYSPINAVTFIEPTKDLLPRGWNFSFLLLLGAKHRSPHYNGDFSSQYARLSP